MCMCYFRPMSGASDCRESWEQDFYPFGGQGECNAGKNKFESFK
ncbi:unnamed protein product, partial [Allacma fusca]